PAKFLRNKTTIDAKLIIVAVNNQHVTSPRLLIKVRISSTRQAVVLSPSFTGFGYLPHLTPLRNVVRLIGSKGGMPLFLSPII
ncbi:MAG: hypothetical protein ACXW00_13315, partial [Methylobacter sp.]